MSGLGVFIERPGLRNLRGYVLTAGHLGDDAAILAWAVPALPLLVTSALSWHAALRIAQVFQGAVQVYW
jgi:hypothetical protein